MSFNGKEGGLISLEDGAAMTARYRANFPTQIKARFFGKEIITKILDQSGAVGIRMYFAQNANNEMELVICAADGNENDILVKIGDLSIACPANCSAANSLNT
ncbi:MAG: hypothetical protein IPO32_14305 [Crocinitomicaceae bacterium]|nr:hypothetical protein [Crocinitomicaceae bacterium]